MKVVVQRVKAASVSVNNQLVSEIGLGFLLLVGFTEGDGLKQIEYMARKIARLRIFADENQQLNLDIKEVGGSILSISQFTVYGDTVKSNRPSFTKALAYQQAEELYLKFNEILRKEYNLPVKEGLFGEEMEISLINHGPVTIIIEKD
jgi:D-tyrosyl-tRNA(Tyr) deacylase